MSDIVADLFDRPDDTRTAQGKVDGVMVAVKKESYLTSDQTEQWKVEAVTLEGDRESRARLDKHEANEYFEQLLGRYDLHEQ